MHFQFPSPRFPHGCDVEASFRNAQVTHAGTPRGGTQEFLRAGRGQPRAPSAGRPRATRASRERLESPSSSEIPCGWRHIQLKGKKRELPSLLPSRRRSATGFETAGAERRVRPPTDVHTPGQTASPTGRPWGSASARPPPRPGSRPSAAASAVIDRGPLGLQGTVRLQEVSGVQATGCMASRMRGARPAGCMASQIRCASPARCGSSWLRLCRVSGTRVWLTRAEVPVPGVS